MMKTTLTPTDFIAQFGENVDSFPAFVADLRKEAIHSFEQLGIPTTKNEDWKYTNLTPLLQNSFRIAERISALSKNDISDFIKGIEDEVVLVFENGIFRKDLSLLEKLPAGVVAGALDEHSAHPAVQANLGKLASFKSESFVALNTAFFNRGGFVFTDKNIQSHIGIHLIYINDSRKYPVVIQPRNLYVALPGSSVKISESYYSMNAVNPSFCNPVTEVMVEENASLELIKNQSENNSDFHIDYTSVAQKKNSNFHITTVTTGGRIVRNNLRIELQGINSSAILNGLYVVSGENHIDNHSFVNHASPNCFSNELYKGILDDRSHAVFNGRIYVSRDAQKTNAYQSNKNILLSDDAVMNAKPQLEIYADDVKCSHGATTGQLDTESLFYLRSRGIGENQARALLTHAFAEEILDKVSLESIKEKLQSGIQKLLLKENS